MIAEHEAWPAEGLPEPLKARLDNTLSELRRTAEELSERSLDDSAGIYAAKAEGFALAINSIIRYMKYGV